MTCPRDKKLCTADEAVALISDGQTVATSGFVAAAHAEALTAALERRFLATGTPRGLTLLFGAGQGDGARLGLNHLAHAGLVARAIGGHWGLTPGLGRLALEGKIEAYNFPQGVLCQLYRDIAAGRPGCVTHVGLGTYIDPEFGGGRLNDRTPPDLVERIELGGRTWLWYHALPIHVGIIRATAADPAGNLVMDEEVIIGDVSAIAPAVHNSGGVVLAQVRRLLDEPAPPQLVRVPGMLVDKIIVAEDCHHPQTYGEPFNPEYCRPVPESGTAKKPLPPIPLDERRIIAARACDELHEGAIANLGIGMPEGVARIADERGLLDRITLTVESGTIGGMPASGLSFGAARFPQVVVDQPTQFDFYDGRGLDYAALGAAQIDAAGNVNVAKFANRFAGVGGFVNITQTAKRLVFCGTFTAGGLEVRVTDGRLNIVREGSCRKFIRNVELVAFSAARSRAIQQEVFYVTERAVFRLTDGGLELIEVAPGIDIESQILAQMDFRPQIGRVRPMPEHAFRAP